MSILTREQILQADDLKRELVEVPEWGGQVYVRCLTGAERDQLEASILDIHDDKTDIRLENMRARLVSLSVVDEAGQRLFSEADVAVLGRKSAAALQQIFNVAQRLSAITKEDVKEIAKN